MKRPLFSKLYAFITTLLFFLGAMSSYAQQEQNLLTNPGFENPYITVSENRIVAEGWQPWHLSPNANSPSYENAQPIYDQTAPDTTRIRSGSNAQKYYTDLYFTHIGGVFQRVINITPGTELRFSLYAYVWSSNQDDVNISEEPGGVLVQVGIDPTGGTDATSSNVVWSSTAAADQYDAYRQYSIISTATSNAVTVFVRSRVDFPQRNNFIYLDDAVLSPTTDTSPTATTAPTNTDVPQLTNTPIPQPTNTDVPQPTNTPVSVDDPTPTQEGQLEIPTSTTAPTQAPVPTNTTESTALPVVTTAPTQTSIPVGGPISDEFPSTILHTVRRGDTVGRLASLYGSTIEAIIKANNLNEDGLIFVGQGLLIPVRLAAPATITPSATPVVIVITATSSFGTGGAVGTIYIVRPGDTLSGIARSFNTTIAALAQYNGIVNPNLIKAGQQLVIPPVGGAAQPIPVPTSTSVPNQPRTYVVQPGENLYRISLKFGVTMLALTQTNNISNVNLIFAGQVLIIP